MAAWFIDDFDQYQIFITNTLNEYYIPKFRIDMVVEEPILYLRWNDRERGSGGDQRLLTLNYLDVVDNYSGYIDNPSSATDLMNQINTMIVSGWTNIGGGDVLTAKGDLLTHDGVSDVIHPLGANERILSVNTANSDGLEWITKAAVVDGGLAVGDTSITKSGNSITTKSSYVIGYTGNVASTNTTSEEILYALQIPGGTMGAGDALKIPFGVEKTSGAGTFTTRFRLHTSNAVGGSIFAALAFSGTVRQLYEVNILNTAAAVQVGSPATTPVYGQFGVAFGSATLDTASDIWLLITSQKVTGTDAASLVFATVNHLKYRT